MTTRTYKTQIRIVEPKDVRKVAQRCINELMFDGDGMTVSKAKAISTLLNTSLRAMEQAELLEKMESIENMMEERGSSW